MPLHRLFCYLCLLLFTASGLQAEPNSAQRLEEVQTEIESLSNALDKDKKARAKLNRQLKQQSKAVSTLNREYAH